MKNLKLLLFFALFIGTSTPLVYGQCSGCFLTITAPSSATYNLTANTTVCIVGTGSFTGVLNNFSGNTLCIGTGVTYNPSTAPNYNGNWTIINNGTFQNVSNLNFNSGTSFTNNATGTINIPSTLNLNSGIIFNNYGTLTVANISINSGATVTLGGTTTISGFLSNNGALTVSGALTASSITVNSSGTIVGGSGSNCNSIKSTGPFTNTGTIGNSGQYLYVGNTGGTINSPATTVSPTAPASQPTSLVLGNTGSTINGSFTQCTSNGYVVLRAIAASLPATTNPTNLSSLVVGQTLGAWTVAAINSGQATTTFSDNVGATCSNIYYAIYAYNSGGYCRVYNVSSPLTGSYNFTPSITGSTPASRCGTGTVTLGAVASAGTINWYAAATGGVSLGTGTSFTTPSIASTTTYYVDATYNGCTTATRTAVTATVTTISGTTPASICGTGTVTLGATASAGTINWYAAPTGGLSLGTGTSYTTPSISTTTTYYVDATYGGCTTSPRTAIIATINTIPTITSSTPASRCGTGTVTLGAVASAGTINWYAAATGGASLGTGTSFTTPSIASTTAYYVDATNNGCTTATRTSITATINTVPTITSSTPASRCGTGTVTLGAVASAGTINWYAAATGGASLGTGTSFTTPSISATTTYYVDATNNGCTTASRTSVIATVNPIPTITGNTPASICGTGTVTLGATASAGTINWYAAATGGASLGTGTSFTTPSIATTTTYYVDATNNGCTTATRTAITATIKTIPTITSSTPGSSCGTGTVTLGAAASAGTINWYAAATGGASLGTGTSFTTPSIATTTTYYVDATNNGCTTATRTSITATINTVPTITTTTPASRCDSGTLTLGAVASAGTINWYAAATGGVSLGTGTSFSTPSITTTTTYYVDATNTGCTTATRTAVIATVNATPVVTGISGSRTGAGTVTLGATTSVGTINWYTTATGGSSIATGTSFTTPVLSTTTTYYIDATNSGCTTATRVAVVATIKYPEIDVQGNGTSIVSGSSSPSTADWTDFGTNLTRTFTIYNTGVASLSVGSIFISGANASDFSVTTAPNSTVPIGSSTTFTITYSPSVVGLSYATITFSNNDTDENPYSFDIQATAIEQEIDIKGNGVSIADGSTTPSTSDWTDFSNVAGTRTYTISNLGSLPLNIGAITIGGANASDFTVTTPPNAVVDPFSSTTFTVAFNPSAINTRTATISIVNDDSNENPYDFTIQGFGIMPAIDIQGNGVSIPDSTIPAATTTNWTDFSTVAGTRTFTIFNNGNLALTIGAITFTGTNASEFTVTTPPSATVAAFSSTTFTVTFAPTALGTRTATIHIVDNDSVKNPYDFNLQGTGVAREIDLQGNGLSIASGDMVTSVNDGTDFGPADINLATVTRTFSILNTGSIPLTISNPTISGANASEFSITANPSTLVIGSNSSTTFQVTFNPSAVFTRVALITIVNNDSDENPYTFAIQGTGLLDNDGDGVENNIDQDDDNDGILDSIECGTCVSDPFVNGSFESTTPLIPAASWALVPVANIAGWQTTPENVIEVWSSGMNGGAGPVTAAAGNQFVELNANVPGTLYQTFCLNGAGGTINWALKHRGRLGVDVAAVKFGPTLATVATVATLTDNNTAWGSYSGTFSIPVGQTTIVIAFGAVSSVGGLSYGNLLDDVQIIINQNCIDSDGDGVPDITDVDSDNDGIPDIEEAGFKAYSNGKSTMDMTSSATWVDANHNGVNDYIDAMIAAGTYLIPDTDGDGVKNYLDLDSDNDSLFDVDEANLLNGDGDINGDGKGDGLDSDGDGLLDLYDNSPVFGTTTRAYAQDTDGNGTPDFLDLDSNDDGIFDIQTGLYGSLDANNDGKIDGSGDADGDGITDTFDTNTAVKGSPRNLNRKLYLDFDGRNDYAEDASILSGLSNATLMAWIDLNPAYAGTDVVVGQSKFQIRVTSAKILQVIANSSVVTCPTPLTTARWYHVAATYGNGFLTLYLNGKVVGTPVAVSGSIVADATKLTLGKNPAGFNGYFKGKIDEVRVFNTALTATQLQRMVYQEIQNSASLVQGAIVPKDIGAIPFANMLRYYRMDTYKDDIVDDLTTPTVDTGTGMKLYNHKVINVQQAPMPFTTVRTGTFAAAVNDPTKDIRGLDVTDFDYSIIQVKHNITDTANGVDLAMTVDPGVTITMNNDTKLQNDWYLKLDGSIILNGKSQLVQTSNSDLDVTSAGSINRDQQGQSNKYNYNYWSSPVSTISNTTNNLGFTVAGVMKDGTTGTPQNITWTGGFDGSPTSPITLSNRWIYKFQNISNSYANWTAANETTSFAPAQGYTLKGSGAASATQNYTFVGKPNNGAITTTVAAGNLNLCGNPYPSAIDANAFITANSSAITGTLYFWQHASNNNTHSLSGYQGGYASLNLTGGTAPVAPAYIYGVGLSTKTPKRYIPVGQGFFVVGSATGGTITFDNSQRGFVKEDDAINSTTLFKSSTTIPAQNSAYNNAEDVVEKDTFKRVRIGITSTDNYYRQILLGFMENHATDGFDVGYDGATMDTQLNDMYFMNNGAKLSIQGVGYFDDTKTYPLGIKANTAGAVSIRLDETENMDANQSVYIFDATTGQYHDITTTPYTVQLPQGLTENRFSLTFRSNAALATSTFDLQSGINIAYANASNMLNIKNNVEDTTVEKVLLYNMLGQEVAAFDVKEQNQQNLLLPIRGLSTGTYIVKVKTDKGDTERKIVFN